MMNDEWILHNLMIISTLSVFFSSFPIHHLLIANSFIKKTLAKVKERLNLDVF